MRPPIPSDPHTGGCLCGAARYRMDMQPKAVNACHCTDCKRASGGTHAIFLHVERDKLVLLRGELSVFRKTADSGRDVDISRCAACGTRLWHAPTAGATLVFVAAGTLDDPSWVVPTSHIWASRRAVDVPMESDALVYPEQPDNRQALWDRFGELYPGLA